MILTYDLFELKCKRHLKKEEDFVTFKKSNVFKQHNASLIHFELNLVKVHFCKIDLLKD